jgi:hypothetical protein
VAEPIELELLRAVFDAYPAPTYLLDRDVGIHLMNRAAAALSGPALPSLVAGGAARPCADDGAARPRSLHRSGEALRCLQQESSGCGKGRGCARCVIRSSVAAALDFGAVHRVRAFMQLREGDAVREVYFLVSAAPLAHGGVPLAVLTLEDVTALARLKSLLPMCAGCRKIRTDEDYWQSLESYLKEQLDVDVSHGFCEACVERLYPEIAETLKRGG